MTDFVMPSLGADMESGTLVEWRIAPGQQVRRGDVVAVVETQKGAIEIEIFEDGVVEEICVPLGREVPVGAVLARLAGGAGPRCSAGSAARGRSPGRASAATARPGRPDAWRTAPGQSPGPLPRRRAWRRPVRAARHRRGWCRLPRRRRARSRRAPGRGPPRRLRPGGHAGGDRGRDEPQQSRDPALFPRPHLRPHTGRDLARAGQCRPPGAGAAASRRPAAQGCRPCARQAPGVQWLLGRRHLPTGRRRPCRLGDRVARRRTGGAGHPRRRPQSRSTS